MRQAVSIARGDLGAIDAALGSVATERAEADAAAIRTFLAAHGLFPVVTVAQDFNPIPPWRTVQTIVVCDKSSFSDAMTAMQGWDTAAREAEGLSGRVTVVIRDSHELIPFGLRFFGTGGILPIDAEAIGEVATALGEVVRSQNVHRLLLPSIEDLLRFSYERVRSVNRDSTWVVVEPTAPSPLHIADTLRELSDRLATDRSANAVEPATDYVTQAIEGALNLAAWVNTEDPATGLAAQIAAIDVHNITDPEPGSSSAQLNAIQMAALEADRSVTE